MMDMLMVSEIFNNLMKYLIAPLGAFVWWMFKKYDMRMDSIEKRTNIIERDHAVLANRTDNMKEDMTEIKSSLNTLITMLKKLN